MTNIYSAIVTIWWLIHKDLIRELRTWRFLPGTLLLGVILVTVMALQVESPVEEKEQIISGMLWLAVIFAGTLVLEPSFSNERDDGCWQTLLLYPASPALMFLAKMAVNLCSIIALELILLPLFVALTDVPLLSHPAAIALIAGLSNIGFAAVGTLVGAITASLRHRTGLVAVLLFPLLIPLVLASSSATNLMLAGDTDQQWWRWIQLLAVFATVFTIGGALMFEIVIEES